MAVAMFAVALSAMAIHPSPRHFALRSAMSPSFVRMRGGGTDRVYAAGEAKGGDPIEPSTTALVMIEYQNEFTTEGGKLHPAVKPIMDATNMLAKSAEVADAVRAAGAKVIHSPITFEEDMRDNPNPRLGILAGVNNDKLFVKGTWNAAICDAVQPKAGDLFIEGKKGLDAFPGTNLEDLLVQNGIKTVVLSGFLTNCCVESTMRTAYEKGFNVVTLTDCTATTSEEGQKAATEGTYGMFSRPMTKDEFLAEISK